jgi:N-acyl-L-homoserine lactone synthetase
MGEPAQVTAVAFADRIAEFLERVDYRVAESSEDRDQIFRLRYEAYVREGTIQPNLNRRVIDAYDSLPNAWTFGVDVDGKLAGSIRIHVSSPEYPDMPALHVFPEFLRPEVEAGKIIVDPTRFVADPGAGQHLELPYATLRLAHMASEHFKADYVLATVRAEHRSFYKRVFGAREICPPRPYPSLNKPISLMMTDRNSERGRNVSRYPFLHSSAFERRMLFDRKSSRSASHAASQSAA